MVTDKDPRGQNASLQYTLKLVKVRPIPTTLLPEMTQADLEQLTA